MKKIYILFSFLSSANLIYSQTEKCGTMPNLKANCENISGYKSEINSAELNARKWMTEHKEQTNLAAKTHTTLMIPVVFHCVYKSLSSPTYIADSTFARQIDIMNETYSLSNPNYSNTRAIFDTMGANIDVQFCFANVDPSGNPFGGVMRYQNNANWVTTPLNNQIKTTYPNWDPSKYLNIWTCDMSFFGTFAVLGFSTFPGGPANLDGVVLESEFVGYQTNGTTNNLGRTMVHEVGHWLGMRHIWGDGQQATNPCDSTDYVEDTPRANNASQTDCDTTKNTCSNEDLFWSQFGIDPPDMVENYMDYSNDACMTMFTKGQKVRMWSFINTARASLLTNTVGCSPVGINSYNQNFESFITVYPNPSEGIVNLNITTGNLDDFKIDFYNCSGQIVKSLHPTGFQNQINVKDLCAGIYFIKISNQSNIAVKKIIIEK